MIVLISIQKRYLFNVKIKIYHQTMRVITKKKCNNKYLLKKFPDLYFEKRLYIITLKSTIIKGLSIMYANRIFDNTISLLQL